MPKVFDKSELAPKDAINVGSGTQFASDLPADRFELYVRGHVNRDLMINTIRRYLKGVDLVCDQQHGEVLLRIANSEGDPFALGNLLEALPIGIKTLKEDVKYIEGVIAIDRSGKEPPAYVHRLAAKLDALKLTVTFLEHELEKRNV